MAVADASSPFTAPSNSATAVTSNIKFRKNILNSGWVGVRIDGLAYRVKRSTSISIGGLIFGDI